MLQSCTKYVMWQIPARNLSENYVFIIYHRSILMFRLAHLPMFSSCLYDPFIVCYEPLALPLTQLQAFNQRQHSFHLKASCSMAMPRTLKYLFPDIFLGDSQVFYVACDLMSGHDFVIWLQLQCLHSGMLILAAQCLLSGTCGDCREDGDKLWFRKGLGDCCCIGLGLLGLWGKHQQPLELLPLNKWPILCKQYLQNIFFDENYDILIQIWFLRV